MSLMMNTAKKSLGALVLSGDGINCEIETAAAARESGFKTKITHVNDLVASKGQELNEARLMIIPGGFSFGDELGSGKILALKLKHGLGDALEKFISGGGAVFGICNGFQVMTRLGVFGATVELAQNEGGHFLNRWVGLELTGHSIFTNGLLERGVTRLELPMRHGEGRLVWTGKLEAQAVMRYEENVNGSTDLIAGVSAFNGRVMGLMPHPEAFWCEELHPSGNSRHVPLGVEMFRSAFEILEKEQ